MTLYEMTEAAKQLYAMLDSGEIDEQTVNDTIQGMMIPEKLEGYCQVIRQFKAEAEAYKAEKEFFEEKQKRAENSVKRLEGAVLDYMATTDSEVQQAGKFELKVTKSKAVQILDENEIPPSYLVWQPPKIDRVGIRKALLGGLEVKGAALQENRNLKIK